MEDLFDFLNSFLERIESFQKKNSFKLPNKKKLLQAIFFSQRAKKLNENLLQQNNLNLLIFVATENEAYFKV